MRYQSLLFLVPILISVSGCSSSSYHSSENYDPQDWIRDTSLFNHGVTDYRHHYGFDVFRGYGSFHDGHFY